MSVAEALAELELYRRFNQLEFYRPYAYQSLFHRCPEGEHRRPFDAVGEVCSVRATISGNKVGKCLSFNSLVEHPDGTATKAGELYARGKPFWVNSWDGEKVVPSLAVGFVKKPAEMVYRVTMSDGRWFECAANHRILTSDGYVFVEQLSCFPRKSVVSRLRSSLEFVRSVHVSGVRRLNRTASGFWGRCSEYFRRCGGRLLFGRGSVRGWIPLPVGVPLHSDRLWRVGDLADISICSLSDRLRRLSSLDDGRHFWGRFVSSSVQVFAVCFQYSFRCIRSVRQLVGFGYRPQPFFGGQTRRSGFSRACEPLYVEGNRIISVTPVSVQDIYDFTVPEYKNYVTAGIVHHNTRCAAYEVAFHATGLYPDWWEGIRFSRPVEVLCAGVNNDKTRDICQRELFGDPTDDKLIGTGAVPKRLIGKSTRKPGVPNAYDNVLVRHITGGWSKVMFQAYEQKKGSFMGIPVDVGWMDEEPPKDVFNQFVRGTIARETFTLLLTFTPENGATDLVYEWLHELGPGRGLVRAGWRDAPHIWDVPGKVDELRSLFPKYEWEMRENGDPVIGTGRVYEVPEEQITCDPIELPMHWPRLCGIDFGMDHPFAAVWVAHDVDTDTIYVYDAFKKSDMNIPEAASLLKRHGDWIPVVWPHDMAKRATGVPEQKSGQTIKGLFEDEGCYMLPQPFSNPPKQGDKDGSGGNSVSAGILAITTRMSTGGLKVFSSCLQFFEEYRNYHTENGVIVKKRDDIMDAFRYACMAIRHAQTPVVQTVRRSNAQGLSLW